MKKLCGILLVLGVFFHALPLKSFSSEGLREALILLEKKEEKKALDLLLSLKKDWETHKEFWGLLGTARFRTGDTAGAAEAFQRGLLLAPEDPFLWRNLGWSHYRIEAHKEGIRAFEKALFLSGAGEDAHGLALCQYGAGEFKAAVDTLRPWVEKEKNPGWLRLMGHAALASGRVADSLLGLLRGLAVESAQTGDWMLLARAEDLSGNRGRAALSLEVAGSLGTSDSPDSDLVARMYGAAGLPSAAARILKGAGEGEALERVRLLLAAGRKRSALFLLEKTEGSEARMLEARIHMERGACALALKSLEQAEGGQKGRYAKGLCLWRLGRYQEAGAVFAELAADPDWAGNVRELAARMQALAVLETE